MNNEHNQPKVNPEVSIIIPFKSNPDELITILAAISKQDYPREAVEILCVDNGSVSSLIAESVLPEVGHIVILSENTYLNSPYSARNRGIEHSKGEILIFADANSLPEKNWLSEGVRHLQQTGADIVAGRVNFHFGSQTSGAKIVDALTSIHQKKAVEERGVAYTANLFVRRDVFAKTGFFEEGVRSGGDVRWTSRAVSEGAKIEYCDKSVVSKYARTAKQLYKKRVRTGTGYYYTWKDEADRKKWWYNVLRSLKPPSIRKLNASYVERYGEPLTDHLFSVWFFYYSSSVIEQFAFLKEYVSRHHSKEKL